jgi:hypothetical protein
VYAYSFTLFVRYFSFGNIEMRFCRVHFDMFLYEFRFSLSSLMLSSLSGHFFGNISLYNETKRTETNKCLVNILVLLPHANGAMMNIVSGIVCVEKDSREEGDAHCFF